MTAMRRTSGDGSFLRSLNEEAVLRALRETGTPTLAEVARAAQLSRATTEVIMDALQRNGWVVEAEPVAEGQRGVRPGATRSGPRRRTSRGSRSAAPASPRWSPIWTATSPGGPRST